MSDVTIKIETDVPATMRDGTILRADVYRPDTTEHYPTLVIRMPYNKAQPRYHVFYDPIRVAKSGYAVVWQDCRGTMASHGEYYSFMKEKGGSEHARKYLKFIIGPWFHFADLTQQVGELDFGLGQAAATIDLSGIQLRWFDNYLKGIDNGIIRARYRESNTKQSLIDPGKVYTYNIDLEVNSKVFKSGHRIRVEISSSNFPFYDRNHNTGHPFGVDVELEIATQRIFLDKAPSYILLPVIPS